jgi:hypothetical protein
MLRSLGVELEKVRRGAPLKALGYRAGGWYFLTAFGIFRLLLPYRM